jgi:hypothetical protein
VCVVPQEFELIKPGFREAGLPELAISPTSGSDNEIGGDNKADGFDR